MRLPEFTYLEPAGLDEALEMLAEHGADCRVLAGGTDLLVRMKQRLLTPACLMSLKSVDGLAGITETDGMLKIGAATPLADITASAPVRQKFPALAEAVESVGAVSIQHFRGTIGGNLCQDNRCRFYNQSAFFRSTKQLCHKAGGQICYAREGSDRCRSTCQSDTAPALIALGAEVTVCSRDGRRRMPLMELYTATGEHPLSLADHELLTDIRIPLPQPGEGAAYHRLAYRSAIEYPVVCAGAWVRLEEGTIADTRIVVGAIASGPLHITGAAEHLVGRRAGDRRALEKTAESAADAAAAFAVDNVHGSTEYRMKMAAVMTTRALEGALKRAAGRGSNG